ncbi:MAG: hypothetical protein KGO92_13005, partial [Bacteroidota bacterium]|nr:hypothetical protein [Bacteroidota bacterium]
MLKTVLFVFFLWGSIGRCQAQKVYEFTATCQQAYQEITQLKIRNGVALLAKAKAENPDNLIPVFLESYVDFFTLFLNEDPGDFARLYPKYSEQLAALQEGPKSSPFYNYCLSMVRLHKATTAIKFGKFWEAGWDFRRSFLLIRDNKKLFPDFTPNNLLYGSLQAVIGTIPKGYKWIASLFGMRGSLTEGMQNLSSFVNGKDPWAKTFFNESAFIYPYLLFYLENKKAAALTFVKDRKLDLVNNQLHTYMAANLAINNQQSAYAQSVIRNRNLSDEYLKVSIWDFELGFTKIYHLETQDAAVYLENFLRDFKGKFYVRDALQKL